MADGSVTRWIYELKDGDDEAARLIWERYFVQLAELARRNLRDSPRRVADEDDAVVSAFDSFCRRTREGRFQVLNDRHDLWKLLVCITIRKAQNQKVFLAREKRGGGEVRGESAFDDPLASKQVRGITEVVSNEPTPELAAIVTEGIETFLDSLTDQLRDVACWKMQGLADAEIADKLNCSTRSVPRKLNLIRKKIQLHDKE